MCVVKTPKIDTTPAKEVEPTIIRNPYLDGVGPAAKAQRAGRSSLRIVRGTNKIAPSPTAPPIATSRPTLPSTATSKVAAPVSGGGGRISSARGMLPNAY